MPFMPQPPSGQARSPPLRLLPLGRPCEFPGCGGKEREGAGGSKGAGLPAARRAPAWGGTPPPVCSAAPTSQPVSCREHRSRSGAAALPSGFAADTSHLCPRGHPAPLCGWTLGNIRASAGLGPSRHPEPGGGTGGGLGALSPVPCSPLGAPCPGDCGRSLGYVCPLSHSRAGCPAPRREFSLQFWCEWSWESQHRSHQSSAGAGVWGASPALPGALLELQFRVPAPLSPCTAAVPKSSSALAARDWGCGPGTGAFLRGPQVRGQCRFGP